ncbi:MAG: carbohydrate ABC transporter permease [Firmicutes bacterium]|nr:carbohydrate ABC transporter permease [Bacillota bacterium]
MRTRGLLLGYLVLLVLVFVWIFPLAWMIANSVRPNEEIIAGSLSDFTFTLEHYQSVLFGRQFDRCALNSLIVSVSTTIITVSVSILCAYSMVRFNTGGQPFALTILMTRSVPPAVRIIPFFISFSILGLTNTLLGLVIANLSFNLSLAIWLLQGFIHQIPRDIEEAACIDGCSDIQVLWRIVLPLSRSGVATASILTFIYTWNEFLMAMVLGNSVDTRTLPVAANLFVTGYEINWGPLFAASTMILAPVILLTLVVQQHIVSGLTMGAVKG